MALPTPSRGIILIQQEENTIDNEPIILSQEPKGRLLTGKIIAIGEPHITESGAELKLNCKIGQKAWFLSYEGNYDIARINGINYYFVLFRDLRGYK